MKNSVGRNLASKVIPIYDSSWAFCGNSTFTHEKRPFSYKISPWAFDRILVVGGDDNWGESDGDEGRDLLRDGPEQAGDGIGGYVDSGDNGDGGGDWTGGAAAQSAIRARVDDGRVD
ncbi:hypothetical protein Tco_1031856 [Tanacetum coccineum]|uniref:Uncharacterized protein n=1 Tax=Tanacetum coccineum TaxID=301880 RepID=A0ABQ5GBN6_9ASTR